jgi:23S rRNA (pseudouridine1915-N3)-methyltransferase
MHIKILWVGKTRNPPIRSLSEDYLGRLLHMAPCEIVEIRDLSKGRSLNKEQLLAAEGAELTRHFSSNGVVVALDERGKEFTSTDFARWLDTEQIRGVREMTFVIGGSEGLSPELIKRANLCLSLGRMTWTHELSRLLLLEQIYRAFTIMRKIPYHRA